MKLAISFAVLALLVAVAVAQNVPAAIADLTAQGKSDSTRLFDAEIERVNSGLKICGNYCGPNYCAGRSIDEGVCVATKVWGSPSDGSCVDSCCKVHDYCCGSGNRAACNNQIVSCVSSCSGICAFAVRNAMKIVSNWCCGSVCPRSLVRQMDKLMNITDNSPDPILDMLMMDPIKNAHLL